MSSDFGSENIILKTLQRSAIVEVSFALCFSGVQYLSLIVDVMVERKSFFGIVFGNGRRGKVSIVGTSSQLRHAQNKEHRVPLIGRIPQDPSSGRYSEGPWYEAVDSGTMRGRRTSTGDRQCQSRDLQPLEEPLYDVMYLDTGGGHDSWRMAPQSPRLAAAVGISYGGRDRWQHDCKAGNISHQRDRLDTGWLSTNARNTRQLSEQTTNQYPLGRPKQQQCDNQERSSHKCPPTYYQKSRFLMEPRNEPKGRTGEALGYADGTGGNGRQHMPVRYIPMHRLHSRPVDDPGNGVWIYDRSFQCRTCGSIWDVDGDEYRYSFY